MTILATIIVLGVLIFVHELGHFAAAKLVGVEVQRFSIGLGPRIFGFRKGETEYVLSAIPPGGYVKMGGMDDEVMQRIEGGGTGQPRQPFDVLDLDASVRACNALQLCSARHADKVPCPHPAPVARRRNGPDPHRIAGPDNIDADGLHRLLRRGVFRPGNVHLVAVPAGDLDGAVHVFDREAAAGLQRLLLREILLEPVAAASPVAPFIAPRQEQSGGNQRQHTYRA